MTNLKLNTNRPPCSLADRNTTIEQQRKAVAQLVIQRHFAAYNPQNSEALEHEAIARSIPPSPDFSERLAEAEELADGGFGPVLDRPSACVEAAFLAYAQTELGAETLQLVLATDEVEIEKGWREVNGALTSAGIKAYGAGEWRPFRVANGGTETDTVTPSGVLLVPEVFPESECYATGEKINPIAVLHHELKAHILPQKEAVADGRDEEMLCIRYESDMLRELGLPERTLNWGKEFGTRNQTLHTTSGQYYKGLVHYSESGDLIEVDPVTHDLIGPAIAVAREVVTSESRNLSE